MNEKLFKEILAETEVKIKVATKVEDAQKQGIHLLNPTKKEIADAICKAERDLFHTIFVHTILTFPGGSK